MQDGTDTAGSIWWGLSAGPSEPLAVSPAEAGDGEGLVLPPPSNSLY